jgi:hypothetical protein
MTARPVAIRKLTEASQLITQYARTYSVVLAGYFTAPAFLIIGAQRGGTKPLFRHLDFHPQVTPSQTKEVHFFDEHYSRGARWYHSMFPPPHEMRPDKVTYEATPQYLFHPDVPARIHAYNPSIRLIVLLRNPIDRAFSAWNMLNGKKGGYASFDDMVLGELAKISRAGIGYPGKGMPDYLQAGIYFEQLTRYFAYFPREQILIMRNRELKREPRKALRTVELHLGLRKHVWQAEEYKPPKLQTPPPPMHPDTHALLAEFYRPYNEQLYQLLDVDYEWE